MLLHLPDDAAITLKTKHRRQILLGCGKAIRAAAYIVGTLTPQALHILKGVCRTAYNAVGTQNLASLVHRHIVLAQVHAVGTCLLHPLHMVVEQECGSILFAHGCYLLGSRQELCLLGILHTQLNPSASAFKSQSGTFYITITRVGMCYKLYHLIINFSGLNKWSTGP